MAPSPTASVSSKAALPGRVRPLDTARVVPGGVRRAAYRLVQPVVERLLGFPAMWRLYDDCVGEGAVGADFARRFLERLGVSWHLESAARAALQELRGPLVVVANHPHGGLDALVMMALLQELRPDGWKLLANEVLCALPPVASRLIAVDPLGAGASVRRSNAAGMARARRHLCDEGSALALFPAGRVSHRAAGTGGGVCDREWSDHAVRLAAGSGATLVGLHFSGRNSPHFLSIPPTWSRLRALLLCRELVNTRTRRMVVQVAAVLPPAEVARLARAPRAGAKLRARCHLCADRGIPRPGARGASALPPVGAALPPEAVAAEVATLGDDHRLLRSPDEEIDVLLFAGRQAPQLLRALGRARELTFRDAGQGAGLAYDLAPEDDYYRHLVLWHRPTRELIGAYRLGFTTEILAERGPAGLYLDRVFSIVPEFYARVGPAVELSRSFVRTEYQRDNRALALLWRGLAAAAQRHGCPTFYGSVTISNDHHPATRALLVEYLRRNHADDPVLRRLVSPRRPFSPASAYHALAVEAHAGEPIEALAPLVDLLEEGRRGIPPLMRYYCSLGAKFLAYHVEPTFNNALYCLLRVDLRTIPMGYRRRFLG